MDDFVGIHKTTAGRIVNRVTTALVSLVGRYIQFPENEEGRRLLQSNFYGLARFPRVIGAIDCTHIKIQSPGGDNAEFYRNRKGVFSLNVQAVCDSNNLFLDIVARWPGSCHDSHIFMNSRIKRRFENEEFGDVVLLGDSGYPLREYLMTPLANPQTRSEEMYNRCHISTRTVIERTFGIWKRRFPILSMGIRCKIPLTQKIIAATAVLHNVATVNRENVGEFPEVLDDIFGHNLDRDIHQPALFNIMQQRYLNYFETLL